MHFSKSKSGFERLLSCFTRLLVQIVRPQCAKLSLKEIHLCMMNVNAQWDKVPLVLQATIVMIVHCRVQLAFCLDLAVILVMMAISGVELSVLTNLHAVNLMMRMKLIVQNVLTGAFIMGMESVKQLVILTLDIIQ